MMNRNEKSVHMAPSYNGGWSCLLRRRLIDYAIASRLVYILLRKRRISGRVINVGPDAFELSIRYPLNTPFSRGAIAIINFRQVQAIAVGIRRSRVK